MSSVSAVLEPRTVDPEPDECTNYEATAHTTIVFDWRFGKLFGFLRVGKKQHSDICYENETNKINHIN